MKLLDERGGQIFYHDPLVREISFDGYTLQSVLLSPESLAASDVVVIVTDHTHFDARLIVEHSRLVIDARNFTRGITSEKIVRL
ncbi:MAG: hypothetical protein HYT78_21575 [Deltaproteobacteria bacterium]|nr:hypothetical protein [Deltaproteobacteria bacterium]